MGRASRKISQQQAVPLPCIVDQELATPSADLLSLPPEILKLSANTVAHPRCQRHALRQRRSRALGFDLIVRPGGKAIHLWPSASESGGPVLSNHSRRDRRTFYAAALLAFAPIPQMSAPGAERT